MLLWAAELIVAIAGAGAVMALLRKRGMFARKKSGIVVVGLDGDDWKKPQ